MLDRGDLATEDRLGVLRGEGPTGRGVGDDHAALEVAGHDAGVGQPVAVRRVHPGLHLEDEGAEVVVDVRAACRRRRRPCRAAARGRAAGRAAARRRSSAGREANMTGVVSPARKRCLVVVGVVGREQLVLLDRGGPRVGVASSTSSAGIRTSGARVAPPAVRVYFTNSPVRRSSTPRKSPASPTGQVSGVGRSLICCSIWSISSSADEPRAVPLVDDGDHRDAAQGADLEELERLRLEPLARVDQHHGGVDRREHAVGVLGEVAVPGGVDQVDHVVAVVELQRRRRDRDAAGLLHVHPVRDGAATTALAVHGAGLGDDAGVQGERLGQRRLAGVGVADHGEGTALALVGHSRNLPRRPAARRFRPRGQVRPPPRSGRMPT